jgi:hypothetical protein
MKIKWMLFKFGINGFYENKNFISIVTVLSIAR